MSVPTQRRTKSARLRRASHFALKKANLTKCQKCGKPTMPHKTCDFCGTYKGRQIIALKAKKKTLKQKSRERKEATKVKAEKKEAKKKS